MCALLWSAFMLVALAWVNGWFISNLCFMVAHYLVLLGGREQGRFPPFTLPCFHAVLLPQAHVVPVACACVDKAEPAMCVGKMQYG